MKVTTYWISLIAIALMVLSACGRPTGGGRLDQLLGVAAPERFRAKFRFTAPVAGDTVVLTDLNTTTKLIRLQWMKVATGEVSEILLERRATDCREASCTFTKRLGDPGARPLWLTFGRSDLTANYQLITGNWFGEMIGPQAMHEVFFWNVRMSHLLNPGGVHITTNVNCVLDSIDVHEWAPVDRVVQLKNIGRWRSACDFATDDRSMQLSFIVTGLGDDPQDVTLSHAVWAGTHTTEILPGPEVGGPVLCDLHTGLGCD
jgi:hypothetical protein